MLQTLQINDKTHSVRRVVLITGNGADRLSIVVDSPIINDLMNPDSETFIDLSTGKGRGRELAANMGLTITEVIDVTPTSMKFRRD